MATAPSLFLFSSIQIGTHLVLTLGAGKLLGFNQRDLLLASNANVGGKHWQSCVTALCFTANRLCHSGITTTGVANILQQHIYC